MECPFCHYEVKDVSAETCESCDTILDPKIQAAFDAKLKEVKGLRAKVLENLKALSKKYIEVEVLGMKYKDGAGEEAKAARGQLDRLIKDFESDVDLVSRRTEMPGIAWMGLALASVVCMMEAGDLGWRMLWALLFGFFYMGGYVYAKKRGFLIATRKFGAEHGVDLPKGLREDE